MENESYKRIKRQHLESSCLHSILECFVVMSNAKRSKEAKQWLRQLKKDADKYFKKHAL